MLCQTPTAHDLSISVPLRLCTHESAFFLLNCCFLFRCQLVDHILISARYRLADLNVVKTLRHTDMMVCRCTAISRHAGRTHPVAATITHVFRVNTSPCFQRRGQLFSWSEHLLGRYLCHGRKQERSRPPTGMLPFNRKYCDVVVPRMTTSCCMCERVGTTQSLGAQTGYRCSNRDVSKTRMGPQLIVNANTSKPTNEHVTSRNKFFHCVTRNHDRWK